MSDSDPAAAELRRLLDIMAALRDPVRGCPWDVQQDFASIAPYTIEEAYEVADAILRRDFSALPDELGDLLFQVVYHARMAEEEGRFGFAEVARQIADKMVRRHPHVFGEEAARTAGVHAVAWEEQKRAERTQRAETGTLAGLPLGLPALTRAEKLTRRAARVGFDWPDAPSVLAKLDEELAELRAELAGADPARLADELGDMLFVMANLARKLGLDAERCLREANAKFARRFGAVEAALAAQGRTAAEAALAEMEELWQAVKRQEKQPSPARRPDEDIVDRQVQRRLVLRGGEEAMSSHWLPERISISTECTLPVRSSSTVIRLVPSSSFSAAWSG
jgi:ATP diphosphatase